MVTLMGSSSRIGDGRDLYAGGANRSKIRSLSKPELDSLNRNVQALDAVWEAEQEAGEARRKTFKTRCA